MAACAVREECKLVGAQAGPGLTVPGDLAAPALRGRNTGIVRDGEREWGTRDDFFPSGDGVRRGKDSVLVYGNVHCQCLPMIVVFA